MSDEADDSLLIAPGLRLPLSEVEITAARAQGPGGQNVNKTSAAIQLRFDITASSLPQAVRERLLGRADRRISREGVLLIRAQEFRTQPANRRAALERLAEIVRAARHVPAPRRPTRPSASSRRARLQTKTLRGRTKQLRSKPGDDQ